MPSLWHARPRPISKAAGRSTGNARAPGRRERPDMCGIVGYVGAREATPILLDGLKRLEYRGYDSAGIAVVGDDAVVRVARSEGKLGNLTEKIAKNPPQGRFGVGHTRWATHGRPSEENAHPHRDASGRVVVIHNGIIENFLPMKQRLQKEGVRFLSETDTEVVAQALGAAQKAEPGTPFAEIVRRTAASFEGMFALVLFSADEPGVLYALKWGPPIVLGLGTGENFIASDATALLQHTRDLIFLEDGDLARVTASGETADTVAALKEARRLGARTTGLVNVPGSAIARMVDGVIATHAGPEIGVASTKAFTTQLVALALFAHYVKAARAPQEEPVDPVFLAGLARLPSALREVLALEPEIEKLARRVENARDILFLGRGAHYPIALEGALKLKEISYLHAEGYPGGEMKHGPIALLDATLPVIGLAPDDALYEKIASNLREAKARDAVVIALVSPGDADVSTFADAVVTLPKIYPALQPIVSVVPLQLLAYHVARRRGCDVDQPRNLAKSVTVE